MSISERVHDALSVGVLVLVGAVVVAILIYIGLALACVGGLFMVGRARWLLPNRRKKIA